MKLRILRPTLNPSCFLTKDQMFSQFYNVLNSYPQLKDQLLAGEESQAAKTGFSGIPFNFVSFFNEGTSSLR